MQGVRDVVAMLPICIRVVVYPYQTNRLHYSMVEAAELGHDVRIECLRHTELIVSPFSLCTSCSESASSTVSGWSETCCWTICIGSAGSSLNRTVFAGEATNSGRCARLRLNRLAFPPLASLLARRTLIQSFQGTTFSSGNA